MARTLPMLALLGTLLTLPVGRAWCQHLPADFPGGIPEGEPLHTGTSKLRIQGHLRGGYEDVTLERSRLRPDGQGSLSNQEVLEGGLQQRLSGAVTMVQEKNLGRTWIMDTETRFDFDTFSETQVTSERYDRFAGSTRTTFARGLPGDAYLAVELHARSYLEQFLPDLEGTQVGSDVVYEREIKGDGYLQTRLGMRQGTLTNNPGDDYQEKRVEVTYEHLPPDRLSPEVLPFHKEQREPGDWEFLLSHALRLDRARDLIRQQGDAVLLADMSPDPPLPLAWHGGVVRPHVGIRESIFTLGFQGIWRDLESGNAFRRGSLFAGVEWNLTDFLALAVRDTVAAQDWERTDLTRLRSDRLQNHFSVDLAYVKEYTNLSLRLGMDSHFLEDIERLDYHRPNAGIYGSYDPGGRWRISGFLRGSRELNQDPDGDFPDLNRFDSYAALQWRFRRGRRMELSYMREKVDVEGLQSEFDSSYLDQTTRLSYRHRLWRNLYGEAGYTLKDEVHQIFTENNRKDQSGFVNLEMAF